MQAKWTDAILDEVFRSLRRDRTDLDPQKLDRTRALMAGAIRDVLVVGYEPLIEAVALPDPDDRHVLAAAIKARAQLIVTHNLKDFPADRLAPWNIQAVSPDDFVSARIDLDRDLVYAAVTRIADSRSNPPSSVHDVLARLDRDGLVQSSAALRSG